LSCKVSTNHQGEPLGYGFVHYESKESADKAVEAVNGKIIAGQTVSVDFFKSKAERGSNRAFTNLYVKNIPLDFTDEQFTALFAKFGSITSCKIAMSNEGKSRGFGFVNFGSAEEAKACETEMNNFEVAEGKRLFVARAQKKSEREKLLKERFETWKIERQKKYAGVNLYIKNLSDEVDDERLRTEFANFGSIASAVVMRDSKTQKSKGFGFVCFSAQEEAMKAMTDMNGRMLDGKPLYVALAQRLEERKARFEARWAQRSMAKGGIPQPMYTPVPHMGPPRPMVYGAPMMHPWPNQSIPMNRIGGPAMNYALMPAQANRNGGPPRRGGRGGNRGPNQGGNAQRQGQNFKYAENVRNPRQQAPQPTPQPAAQPAPAAAANTQEDFVKDLAAMPEANRKHVIGERLYPLVLEAQPDLAPKITGMLLEMENPEIIELLDSPQALEKKIQEALHVLKESEAAE